MDKEPCSYCLNARSDPTGFLTDDNDFSSFTLKFHFPYRLMLDSGWRKPLRFSFEMYRDDLQRWVTLMIYFPKFCPFCGREITEYNNAQQSSPKT